MKKTLITILGILLGFVGFSSSELFEVSGYNCDSRKSTTSLTYFCNSGTSTYHITGLIYRLRDNQLLEYTIYDITNNNLLSTGTSSLGYCKTNTFISTDFNILPNSCVSFTGVRYNYWQPYLSFNINNSINGNITPTLTYTGETFFGMYYEEILPPANNSLNIIDNNGNILSTIEIEDGGVIELFINSPVIKVSDNIYQYDGSTGFNLFYNNSSIFYDKNKLFLVGQFRFRNNVFTPICL